VKEAAGRATVVRSGCGSMGIVMPWRRRRWSGHALDAPSGRRCAGQWWGQADAPSPIQSLGMQPGSGKTRRSLPMSMSARSASGGRTAS